MQYKWLFGAILLALTLTACGQSNAPRPETPLPTASIQNAAAATPTVMPANAASSETLLHALQKTLAAPNARYELAAQITLTQNDAPIAQPGIRARGQENGANRQLVLEGGPGASATFEFIVLDGETFIKGLSGMPGIDPAQWYRFSNELGNITRDAPNRNTLLAALNPQTLEQSGFASAGHETFDGQDCSIWLTQDLKLVSNFIGIANSQVNDLNKQNAGELRVWTCADGYIHQLRGSLQGHLPANPTAPATMQLTVHLFDYDAPITITAPDDARDFQAPVQTADETPSP